MGVLALCRKKGSVAAVKQCCNMLSWFWSCLEMQERFGCALFKVGNARWWRQNCMKGAIQNCLTFCSCFPRNMFGIPWACLGWQLTVTFKSCHYLLTGHRRPKGRWRRGGDGSRPRWGRGGWIITEKSNPRHCQSSQHVHPNQRAREGRWHQQS